MLSKIIWIYGMLGSGKSTIEKSIRNEIDAVEYDKFALAKDVYFLGNSVGKRGKSLAGSGTDSWGFWGRDNDFRQLVDKLHADSINYLVMEGFTNYIKKNLEFIQSKNICLDIVINERSKTRIKKQLDKRRKHPKWSSEKMYNYYFIEYQKTLDYISKISSNSGNNIRVFSLKGKPFRERVKLCLSLINKEPKHKYFKRKF